MKWTVLLSLEDEQGRWGAGQASGAAAHLVDVDGAAAIRAHHDEQQLLQALQLDAVLDGRTLCRHAEHESHPAGVCPHL